MTKTRFFHSCLGVFQGGGCRAAALVGAYEEAVKRGVQFVEVAGTSAGSIIAALVGAGATPEQLKKFVAELNFQKFLKPPEITKRPKLLTRLAAKPFGRFADLVFHQGFHSSKEVEDWVELRLRDLLGKHQGPIPFSKLPYPTSIVSTDILSRKACIWNQKVSPNQSVAEAVRASCSIPIFFQPFKQQYVDGGVLSNLPAFVFANNAMGRPLSSRILAFVLKGDDEKIEDWATFPFLSAVVNTIVDGAQELQMELQSDVHAIVIPTGTIKATDFGKINAEAVSSLMKAGQKASEDFFHAELTHVRTPRLPSAICYDLQDLYTRITTHLSDTVQDVLIGETDTNFVYELFPSLLLWRMRGARMRVVIPRTEKKQDHGLYRKRLLVKLGAEVVETDEVPFRGFFINCHDSKNGSAYVAIPSETHSQSIEAVIYEGTIHEAAIAALYERLVILFKNTIAITLLPSLMPGSQDALLARLKTVNQYSKEGVQLSVEEIKINDLVALAGYVHEYKYRQFQSWIPEFEKRNLRLFGPSEVDFGESVKSIITPPVVEEDGGKYVLIEGSTRATFLRDQGHERIMCVVVRGIRDPLPGKTSSFSHVRVVGRRADVDFRYEQFNYSYFRKIELAVHPLNSFL